MDTSKIRAWAIGLMYVATAVLAVVKTAVDAGQPMDEKLVVSVLLAALVAWRAYMDKSMARIPPSGTPMEVLNIAPKQTPALHPGPLDDMADTDTTRL